MHICQKLHFYNLFAFTFAGIAPATIYIKRKMFGLKAPYFTHGLFAVQVSYFIVSFYVSNRVTTR